MSRQIRRYVREYGRIGAAGALTALVVMANLSPAAAQQPPPQPAQPGAQQQTQPPAPPAGPNTGRISIAGGVDFPTDYYFRGIVQETEDTIMQPYLNVTFKLFEAEQGALTGVNFTAGIWNSLHWGPTGESSTTVGDPQVWYEADIIAGLSAVFFKDVTLGVTYTAYTSPNGFFNSVQELALGVAWNDSGVLGPFALNPSATLAFELRGQADAGAGKGTYLQLGVAPGVTFFEKTTYPLAITFPFTVGLSLDDYYERIGVGGDDDTFGYFDAGVNLSVPIAFIPPSFGSWQLKASLHALFLGDNLKAANNNDRTEIIGSIGIAFTY